jgi:putative membrane protein
MTRNPVPPNFQVELARERNRVAADRSLMSWIRISLTLISFGFGIHNITQAIYGSVGNAINPVRADRILGLAFIGLGTVAIATATLEHHHELSRLQRPDYTYTPRPSLGASVAIALIVIAVASSAWIAWKIVSHQA